MLSVKKKDQEMSVVKKKDGDMTIETNDHLVINNYIYTYISKCLKLRMMLLLNYQRR